MVRRKLFGAVIAAVIPLVDERGRMFGHRRRSGQALDRYLEAFDARDVGKASAFTDNPALARAGIEQVWQGSAAEKVSTSSGHARTTADNADIDVTYTWKLAGGQTWQYPATVKVAKSTQGWTVRWARPICTRTWAAISGCCWRRRRRRGPRSTSRTVRR